MIEDKKAKKKEGSGMNTFPVPFALERTKENINIISNIGNIPSKEKIINQAIKFHLKGNISEATKYYKYCLNQGFIDHRVFSNYGVILRNLGKTTEAEQSLRKAIELNPSFADAHSNLGLTLKDLGKLKEAEQSLRKAIELENNFAEAMCNLGGLLIRLNKLEEAEKYTRKAIQLKPNLSNAHHNLGNILKKNNKLKEAELSMRKAIQHNPNLAEAHSDLGVILNDYGKLKEAELSTRKAIQLNPNLAAGYSNLGIILNYNGKLKEAELSTRKAIQLNPDLIEAHMTMGTILKELEKLEEAAISFEMALKKDPTRSEAIAELIQIFSDLSSWNDVEKYIKLLSRLDINIQDFNPMKICHVQDEPLLYLKRATNSFNKNHKREVSKIDFIKKKYIHIGYFSADFIAHPVMYLLARILELHDSSKFKIYIYSFAVEEDEYTQRLKESPFKFRSIYGKSDLEAVEIARNDNLDIAIDLMGHTKKNRMNIFSYRVSPVQICYLCSTTGSKEIDYFIADKVVIPKELQKYYSEKILYMPNSFMCFDDTRNISNKSFTRKELNLPDDGFIMAAFHRNRKITIKEIESWSRILNHVSNAILWISSTNEIAEKNILEAFKERGVKIDNILFAPKMKSNEEHLSRHLCADLFIDTFNWNANSTAIDSLWVGLPVVTLLGKSFIARTSASLLTTLGLTELIAHTEKEYEDIIISLAENPQKLREVKSKLINSKYTNPLFNSKQITKDLESIFCDLVYNLRSANHTQNDDS